MCILCLTAAVSFSIRGTSTEIIERLRDGERQRNREQQTKFHKTEECKFELVFVCLCLSVILRRSAAAAVAEAVANTHTHTNEIENISIRFSSHMYDTRYV